MFYTQLKQSSIVGRLKPKGNFIILFSCTIVTEMYVIGDKYSEKSFNSHKV